MKIFITFLCLSLTACVNNSTDLEVLCYHKDPNQMTEREIDICKAFMQRPIIYKD